LKDARDQAKEALEPVLISQGKDRAYAAAGLEFVAYTNLTNAEENLNAA
jgi:hypothetical protein